MREQLPFPEIRPKLSAFLVIKQTSNGSYLNRLKIYAFRDFSG